MRPAKSESALIAAQQAQEQPEELPAFLRPHQRPELALSASRASAPARRSDWLTAPSRPSAIVEFFRGTCWPQVAGGRSTRDYSRCLQRTQYSPYGVRQPACRRQAQLPPCRAKTLASAILNESGRLFLPLSFPAKSSGRRSEAAAALSGLCLS